MNMCEVKLIVFLLKKKDKLTDERKQVNLVKLCAGRFQLDSFRNCV